MRAMSTILLCALIWQVSQTPAIAQTGKLLSTASLAKEVGALNGHLTASPPYASLESRHKAGLVVRDRISQFIIDQIAAKPDISQDQLRAQLQAILCSSQYVECGPDQLPHVFTNVWFGPNGIAQFAVAYQLSVGSVGPTGNITVIESYLVKNGTQARRVARGGNEFDAYVASFQMVQQFFDPAEIWVLTWGTVQGASGRGLSGRATLYRVGTDALTIAWSDARQFNVVAQANAIGWELNYADGPLLYGNDPKPYFLDVYQVDYQKRTFARVVHYQHAAE